MASLSRISWLLVFILFALPLLFFPWTYMAFEMPKVFLLYIFSVSAVYFLLKSGYRFGNLTKTHWLYLIFLVWIAITAILGLSWQNSFWGSYFRMQGILTWICYSLLFFISGKIFDNNHFRKMISLAILASSSVAAFIAIAQFISLWFFGNTSQLLYNNRVISTFGQPNFLGAFLVMSLPFIWYLFKQVKGLPKALVILGLIITILGIISTFSRSAYVGFILLALTWGIYHYRLLLAGITSLIILFALLANLFPNLVYQEWYRFQVDTVSKWTAENRLIIAQKSINLILKKPLTGYGIENFSLAFPSVVTADDLGLKDIIVDSSHNLFLDIAVQTGLVGLGLFVTVCILTFIRSLKHETFTKTALTSAVAFLAIHQFSPVSMVPAALFWLSLGIINGPVLSYTNLSKSLKFILSIVGISLLIITSLLIYQTIRADILFREASAYEVSDIQRSINLDNDAIEIAPWIQFYQIRRNFLLKQLGY
ncbi:O-antigen ligase family protein [Candidatus Daviesbacteria bacterium]|nr:O-antigen ligase family protein [Candidatus Daviesbacteria bacterium]